MRITGILVALLIILPFSAQAKGEEGAPQSFDNVSDYLFVVYDSIEHFRSSVFERTVATIDAIQEKRRQDEARLRAEVKDEANVDALITAQARPHIDNVEDSSGIVEGLMMQALQVVAFIFGRALIFYVLAVLLIAWIVRMAWRRFAAR